MAYPLSITQEIADDICEHLTQGKSLISIRKDEGMPSLRAVKRWLQDERFKDFQAQYAIARDICTERVVEEIIEIAETESDSNKASVMIDARKWVASKLQKVRRSPAARGPRQSQSPWF